MPITTSGTTDTLVSKPNHRRCRRRRRRHRLHHASRSFFYHYGSRRPFFCFSTPALRPRALFSKQNARFLPCPSRHASRYRASRRRQHARFLRVNLLRLQFIEHRIIALRYPPYPSARILSSVRVSPADNVICFTVRAGYIDRVTSSSESCNESWHFTRTTRQIQFCSIWFSRCPQVYRSSTSSLPALSPSPPPSSARRAPLVIRWNATVMIYSGCMWSLRNVTKAHLNPRYFSVETRYALTSVLLSPASPSSSPFLSVYHSPIYYYRALM